MNALKKYIIKLFLVVVISLLFSISILDSVFDTISETIINKSTMFIALMVYGVVGICILILAIYIFIRKLSKRITLENNRYYQEKSTLFANIAHDLKTPMTTIIGFSKALCDNDVKEDEKKELLRLIYQKSMRANELLDLSFQYAKYDALDFKLKIETCDMAKLLREVVAEYYHDFEKKNIDLHINIPETKASAKIDRVEFSRVLCNLIINAYLHNAENAKVMIKLENESDIKITIADNGEMVDVKTIFEPLICGDKSRSTKGGSGLGLAIAKKITKKHGGQLYVDNKIIGYTKGFIVRIKQDTY